MKKALITGITGQDGSYLAELLLAKGYEVHGVIRRASTFNTSRIDHLYRDPHINGVRLFLHYGDLADSVQMVKLLYHLQPDEIYNLGAQSHVLSLIHISQASLLLLLHCRKPFPFWALWVFLCQFRSRLRERLASPGTLRVICLTA